MRSFRLTFVVALVLLGVAAGAQTPASTQAGPSPVDVINAPKTHTGVTVTWVVRFKSLQLDFAPNRTVESDRVVYEWRDETGVWSGRAIIAPPVKQTKWTDAAIGEAEKMFAPEPRMLTGTVRGVETVGDAAGKPSVAVVLDNVTVDLLPLSMKTRIPAGFGGGSYAPGQGVTWPTVVFEAKPVYTSGARTAGIQGSVELEIVVREDGTVSDVRIVKPLDRNQYGLDAAAVESAKQWTFKPGLKDGKPVATRVGLVLDFRISKTP